MADFIVTLDTTQERALDMAAAQHNRTAGTQMTAAEYFQFRSTSYLDALVTRYRETIMNKMSENFDKLTPEQQAAILRQLNITL